MKKLKLNFQQFEQVETLSRTHMRNVLGGNLLATGDVTISGAPCQTSTDCPEGQTCHKESEFDKMGTCS